MTKLNKKLLTNYLIFIAVYSVFVVIFKNDLQTYLTGVGAITAGMTLGAALQIWRTKRLNESNKQDEKKDNQQKK